MTEAALAAARAECSTRESVHAADALAWSLHRVGQDAEALVYAERATALGTADARLLYHRGAIEAALGHADLAQRYLTQSLTVGAGANPWQDAAARALLTGPTG